MKPDLTRAAWLFVAALLCSVSAWSVPVPISKVKPQPLLVVPNESDLLSDPSNLNLNSPYLAGVAGTPAYSGVGTFLVTGSALGPGNVALCTGSLLSPTIVLTAAHCVNGPQIGQLKNVAFVLPNGRPAYGAGPAPNPGAVQLAIGGAVATDPVWNSTSLAGDLALVKLDQPVTGVATYDIYRGNPMDQEATIVGTGKSGWGAVGADSQTGAPGGVFDLRKRVGDNIFEEYGVPFFDAYANQFGIDLGVGGPAQGILLYDFDSGLAQNDVFGSLTGLPLMAGLDVSQLGLPNEVAAAPGDSGSPAFIGGKIAAITSFGITGAILSFDGVYIYCGGPSNIDASFNVDTGTCLDSSFGEIEGNTNIAYYQSFIDAGLDGRLPFRAVPEPATFALLLAGVAGAFRLRRKSIV